MFKYYNYTLIESNRSYSTEKIQTLLKIHPQTIREWINHNKLDCVSKKPILIHGTVLKEFIKNRNEKHKKILNFNEMKCLKCKSISIPKDKYVSIYYNKNGSIRAVGICSNCNNEFSKLYKKNVIEELKNSFFVKPTESTLYNTPHTSSKTNVNNQKEISLNEPDIEKQNEQINKEGDQEMTKEVPINIKTHLKQQKISSKTNIRQENKSFDF